MKRYQHQYDEGLKYFLKSLKIREKLNDKYSLAFSLNGIGVIYYFKKDYLTSQKYYEKSLRIRQEIGDIQGLATSFHNMGVNYFYLGDTIKSLAYQDKALPFAWKSGDKNIENSIYNLLSDIYLSLKMPEKSIEYNQKGIKLAKELDATFLLSNNYERIEKTYQYRLLYDACCDTIENEKNTKALERLRYDYELEKKEKEILLKQTTIERQYALVGVAGVILLSLGILSFVLYRNFKRKQLDHKLLSEQQKEIISQNTRLEELNALKTSSFLSSPTIFAILCMLCKES